VPLLFVLIGALRLARRRRLQTVKYSRTATSVAPESGVGE
jgi:hypothetical protein